MHLYSFKFVHFWYTHLLFIKKPLKWKLLIWLLWKFAVATCRKDKSVWDLPEQWNTRQEALQSQLSGPRHASPCGEYDQHQIFWSSEQHLSSEVLFRQLYSLTVSSAMESALSFILLEILSRLLVSCAFSNYNSKNLFRYHRNIGATNKNKFLVVLFIAS